MKKLLFLLLLALPFAVQAQYTNTFVIGPTLTPAVNYVYVGSLTLAPNNTSNTQKIQVNILGNGFGSTNSGVTTLTIANRDGLMVNEVTQGGLSLNSSALKIYQNGTNTDFYLNVPSSAAYYSFSVKSWFFGLGITGQMVTITSQTATPTGTDITSTATINHMFFTDANGNISINTNQNHNYKLAVNGNVIANSVTIQAFANWPDYVFGKNYKLPELSQVKSYLYMNHHLPDMPSATTIADQGLNVGEVDKALTKKVEELTLYAIKQNEMIHSQQMEIKAMKKEMSIMKKGIKFKSDK